MLKQGLMFLWLFFTLAAGNTDAQIFGTVRGTVKDPQDLVIPAASVRLKAQASAYSQDTQTSDTGTFAFSAVPAGSYTVEVDKRGFQSTVQQIHVTIGSAPVVNFKMAVASVNTETVVTALFDPTNPSKSSLPVSVEEAEILRTPGAEQANSLAFITNFVPGAFLLHDHLHVRGGHQVSWLVDGVPIPNTNLSSNVGRQIDPKDIANVEVSTGGYSAEYGDRTYGVVNIIPRSGFEFENREFELSTGYGTMNETNNQLSFGGHGERVAYYASFSGNRTDLGLEPPEKKIIHNMGNGLSSFTSLTFNIASRDQLRLAASIRKDHYWVPNTAADQALGIRDVNRERDGFANFSWVHTFNSQAMLTISPFFHYNQARYDGGANDPLITRDNRRSKYIGGRAAITVVRGRHNMNGGLYLFHQRDNRQFGLALNDGSGISAAESQNPRGNLLTGFLEEQFKPMSWLTLNTGLRVTRYTGGTTESAVNPRLGVAVQVPRLNWVLRGFWGSYYQAPPLSAIGGPVEHFAVSQGFGFLPLRGERDQQREFGLTVPIRTWALSFSHFRTNAENFSDHDVLGNSNITLPLSIQSVRSRGSEVRLNSPGFRRFRFHLAYANMIVRGRGGITGGMTDFAPPAVGSFIIDHDQRHTLTSGANITLPRGTWFSSNVVAGSGFLDGDGPLHLPAHATLDIAMGKSLGRGVSANFTVLNLTNTRFLLGRDNSFAGTHYNDPRQFSVQLRYRFHL